MCAVNIRWEKEPLRAHYKKLRDALCGEEKAQADKKILLRIIESWGYREEDLLIPYVSKGSEPDTIALIQHALQEGKTVAVPRCVPGTRNMELYDIHSVDDLEKGAFGVLEPVVEQCEKRTDYTSGLCLVPAITFDLQGYRLGYGKGYYDRFLWEFKGRKIGVCYSFCIDEKLPHGKHDERVSAIITEKKMISCK